MQIGPLGRERGERLAEDAEALAGLGEAAHESDGGPVGLAGQRRGLAVEGDRDAVGDLDRSPPRCSTWTLRAWEETAMRAERFSRTSWAMCLPAASIRERVMAVWKVATTGHLAVSTARHERLGVSGSWTWTTSNPPSMHQRRTRAAERGPNARRAIEPL
ncbi:hypothetical protein GCM10029992_53630 [Glycomyces albus]